MIFRNIVTYYDKNINCVLEIDTDDNYLLLDAHKVEVYKVVDCSSKKELHYRTIDDNLKSGHPNLVIFCDTEEYFDAFFNCNEYKNLNLFLDAKKYPFFASKDDYFMDRIENMQNPAHHKRNSKETKKPFYYHSSFDQNRTHNPVTSTKAINKSNNRNSDGSQMKMTQNEYCCENTFNSDFSLYDFSKNFNKKCFNSISAQDFDANLNQNHLNNRETADFSRNSQSNFANELKNKINSSDFQLLVKLTEEYFHKIEYPEKKCVSKKRIQVFYRPLSQYVEMFSSKTHEEILCFSFTPQIVNRRIYSCKSNKQGSQRDTSVYTLDQNMHRENIGSSVSLFEHNKKDYSEINNFYNKQNFSNNEPEPSFYEQKSSFSEQQSSFYEQQSSFTNLFIFPDNFHFISGTNFINKIRRNNLTFISTNKINTFVIGTYKLSEVSQDDLRVTFYMPYSLELDKELRQDVFVLVQNVLQYVKISLFKIVFSYSNLCFIDFDLCLVSVNLFPIGFDSSFYLREVFCELLARRVFSSGCNWIVELGFEYLKIVLMRVVFGENEVLYRFKVDLDCVIENSEKYESIEEKSKEIDSTYHSINNNIGARKDIKEIDSAYHSINNSIGARKDIKELDGTYHSINNSIGARKDTKEIDSAYHSINNNIVTKMFSNEENMLKNLYPDKYAFIRARMSLLLAYLPFYLYNLKEKPFYKLHKSVSHISIPKKGYKTNFESKSHDNINQATNHRIFNKNDCNKKGSLRCLNKNIKKETVLQPKRNLTTCSRKIISVNKSEQAILYILLECKAHELIDEYYNDNSGCYIDKKCPSDGLFVFNKLTLPKSQLFKQIKLRLISQTLENLLSRAFMTKILLSIMKTPSITSNSFTKIIKDLTGRDLAPFFDMYIFSNSIPSLKVTFDVDRKGKVDCLMKKMNEIKPFSDVKIKIHEFEGSFEHKFTNEKITFQCHMRVRKRAKGVTNENNKLAEKSHDKENDSNCLDENLNNTGNASDCEDSQFKSQADTVEENINPLLFIRVDAVNEQIAKINLEQPDYMYIEQLKNDKSVVSQIEAINALCKSPNENVFVVFEKVLNDPHVFYRVRGLILQKMGSIVSNLKTEYISRLGQKEENAKDYEYSKIEKNNLYYTDKKDFDNEEKHSRDSQHSKIEKNDLYYTDKEDFYDEEKHSRDSQHCQMRDNNTYYTDKEDFYNEEKHSRDSQHCQTRDNNTYYTDKEDFYNEKNNLSYSFEYSKKRIKNTEEVYNNRENKHDLGENKHDLGENKYDFGENKYDFGEDDLNHRENGLNYRKNDFNHSNPDLHHRENDSYHNKNDLNYRKNGLYHNKNDLNLRENDLYHSVNDLNHSKNVLQKDIVAIHLQNNSSDDFIGQNNIREDQSKIQTNNKKSNYMECNPTQNHIHDPTESNYVESDHILKESKHVESDFNPNECLSKIHDSSIGYNYNYHYRVEDDSTSQNITHNHTKYYYQNIIQFYIKRYCIHGSTIPKPIDTHSFTTYLLNKQIITSLSYTKLLKNSTHIKIINTFLTNLLKYLSTDNNSPELNNLIAETIKSLKNTLINVDRPDLNILEILRIKDCIFPSYQNLISVEIINLYTILGLHNKIRVDEKILIKLSGKTNSIMVRESAIQCFMINCLDFKGFAFLLKYLELCELHFKLLILNNIVNILSLYKKENDKEEVLNVLENKRERLKFCRYKERFGVLLSSKEVFKVLLIKYRDIQEIILLLNKIICLLANKTKKNKIKKVSETKVEVNSIVRFKISTIYKFKIEEPTKEKEIKKKNDFLIRLYSYSIVKIKIDVFLCNFAKILQKYNKIVCEANQKPKNHLIFNHKNDSQYNMEDIRQKENEKLGSIHSYENNFKGNNQEENAVDTSFNNNHSLDCNSQKKAFYYRENTIKDVLDRKNHLVLTSCNFSWPVLCQIMYSKDISDYFYNDKFMIFAIHSNIINHKYASKFNISEKDPDLVHFQIYSNQTVTNKSVLDLVNFSESDLHLNTENNLNFQEESMKLSKNGLNSNTNVDLVEFQEESMRLSKNGLNSNTNGDLVKYKSNTFVETNNYLPENISSAPIKNYVVTKTSSFRDANNPFKYKLQSQSDSDASESKHNYSEKQLQSSFHTLQSNSNTVATESRTKLLQNSSHNTYFPPDVNFQKYYNQLRLKLIKTYLTNKSPSSTPYLNAKALDSFLDQITSEYKIFEPFTALDENKKKICLTFLGFIKYEFKEFNSDIIRRSISIEKIRDFIEKNEYCFFETILDDIDGLFINSMCIYQSDLRILKEMIHSYSDYKILAFSFVEKDCEKLENLKNEIKLMHKAVDYLILCEKESKMKQNITKPHIQSINSNLKANNSVFISRSNENSGLFNNNSLISSNLEANRNVFLSRSDENSGLFNNNSLISSNLEANRNVFLSRSDENSGLLNNNSLMNSNLEANRNVFLSRSEEKSGLLNNNSLVNFNSSLKESGLKISLSDSNFKIRFPKKEMKITDQSKNKKTNSKQTDHDQNNSFIIQSDNIPENEQSASCKNNIDINYNILDASKIYHSEPLNLNKEIKITDSYENIKCILEKDNTNLSCIEAFQSNDRELDLEINNNTRDYVVKKDLNHQKMYDTLPQNQNTPLDDSFLSCKKLFENHKTLLTEDNLSYASKKFKKSIFTENTKSQNNVFGVLSYSEILQKKNCSFIKQIHSKTSQKNTDIPFVLNGKFDISQIKKLSQNITNLPSYKNDKSIETTIRNLEKIIESVLIDKETQSFKNKLAIESKNKKSTHFDFDFILPKLQNMEYISIGHIFSDISSVTKNIVNTYGSSSWLARLTKRVEHLFKNKISIPFGLRYHVHKQKQPNDLE